MSVNVVYAILCVLVFLVGLGLGVAGTFWSFARDKTVVRLREGEVVVQGEALKELAKRAKQRLGTDDEG